MIKQNEPSHDHACMHSCMPYAILLLEHLSVLSSMSACMHSASADGTIGAYGTYADEQMPQGHHACMAPDRLMGPLHSALTMSTENEISDGMKLHDPAWHCQNTR